MNETNIQSKAVSIGDTVQCFCPSSDCLIVLLIQQQIQWNDERLEGEMASRDCFSKVLPNIKLATRFDADGKEIQVILPFFFICFSWKSIN